jgi:hypothetical protein
MRTVPFPSRPPDDESLKREYIALATRHGLPTDLTSHDGRGFIYHSEKLFIESFPWAEPFQYPGAVEYKNSDVLDLINRAFIESTPIDSGILEVVKSLFDTKAEDASRRLTEESYRVTATIKLNRRLLVALFKMRFVAMRQMISSVREHAERIEKLRNELRGEKTDGSIFSEIQRQLMAVASRFAMVTFGDIDRDAVCSRLLELELEFERQREIVINAIVEICRDLADDRFVGLAIGFIDKRPNLLFGLHTRFDIIFQMAIDKIAMVAKVVRSLTNWQRLKEDRRFSPQEILMSVDSPPRSVFEVFRRLELIGDLAVDIPGIVGEFCDSLALDRYLLGPYFSLAVWTQLNEDFVNEWYQHSRKLLENSQAKFLCGGHFENLTVPLTHSTRDFWLVCCQLRSDVLAAAELVTVYQEDLPVFDFDGFGLNLSQSFNEFLMTGDMGNFEELTREHRRFVICLEAVIRFNNFQFDTEFVRGFFEFETFVDASHLSPEEFSEKYFRQWAFVTLFGSQVPFLTDKPRTSFSYEVVPLVLRTELATLSQIEKQLTHPQYFKQEGQFIEDHKICPFRLLNLCEAFSMTDLYLEASLATLSSRIRIAHFVRLDSSLPFGNDLNFLAFYRGEMNFDPSLIDYLHSEISGRTFVNIPGAFQAFEALLTYRIRLAIIYAIEGSELTDPFKCVWKLLSDCGDKEFRYFPKWMDSFFFSMSKPDKLAFMSCLAKVDTFLSDALVRNPEKSSMQILQDELAFRFVSFAKSLISLSVPFTEIDLGRCVLDYSREGFSPDSLEALVLEQQSQLLIKNNEIRNTLLAVPCSISKPEFYQKRNHRSQLFFPSPVDVERQFQQEFNYRLGKIMQKLSEKKELEVVNEWMDCHKMLDSLIKNWSAYLRNLLENVQTRMDELYLIPRFRKMVDWSYDSRVKTILQTKLFDEFVELNQLRNVAATKKIEQKELESQIELTIRSEFEGLVGQLQLCILHRKQEFVNYHRGLYGGLSQSIQLHLKRAIELDSLGVSQLSRSISETGAEFNYPGSRVALHQAAVQTEPFWKIGTVDAHPRKGKLSETETEIRNLREEIIRSRIYHVFSKLVIPRFYASKMACADHERKRTNSLLWKAKRTSNEFSLEMQLRILKLTQKLTDGELEVEGLRSQIEKVKQENVQHRHWKDLLLRQDGKLEKSIGKLDGDGEPDVQALLGQLERVQTELDALEEEAERFDVEVDHQVREPMAQVDRFHRSFQMQRVHLVEATDDEGHKIRRLQEENARLSGENEDLRHRIADLERKKWKLPLKLIRSIEELTKPPKSLPRPVLYRSRQIFKPVGSARRSGRLRPA